MRRSTLMLAASAALSLLASAGAQPAKAEAYYPYCTAATRWDGPHCYRTFSECVSAIAGQAYTCVPNQWYGDAGQPRRRAG